EENIRQAEATNYDDATFNLLFKDELQEREVARILLEYGIKKWNEEKLVAEYIFEEMVDESLIDNPEVIRLIAVFKELLETSAATANRSYFIHHPDTKLSAFAVSLLNFPYEESQKWKEDFNPNPGYQKNLTEQSYEDFMKTIAKGNEHLLMSFLKIAEDKTHVEVESVLNRLKMRKIQRMIQENQIDLEKCHTKEEQNILSMTKDHLKKMEEELDRVHEHLKKEQLEIARKSGSVIIR
ncbi:MAG: DNA primase, partial [Chitinophagaceae bacterium]|nr:DNA primase [Chitinophagaceae bacterium]